MGVHRQHLVAYHKLKLLLKLMQTVFYKYLQRIKELVSLRRSLSQQKKDVYPKRKLREWLKKLGNYLKKTKRKLKKLLKRPLNGLMITKRQKKKNLKPSKKSWNKSPTQSSKRFTKLVLAVLVVHQKMMKIWMMKIVMNCRCKSKIYFSNTPKLRICFW